MLFFILVTGSHMNYRCRFWRLGWRGWRAIALHFLRVGLSGLSHLVASAATGSGHRNILILTRQIVLLMILCDGRTDVSAHLMLWSFQFLALCNVRLRSWLTVRKTLVSWPYELSIVALLVDSNSRLDLSLLIRFFLGLGNEALNWLGLILGTGFLELSDVAVHDFLPHKLVSLELGCTIETDAFFCARIHLVIRVAFWSVQRLVRRLVNSFLLNFFDLAEHLVDFAVLEHREMLLYVVVRLLKLNVRETSVGLHAKQMLSFYVATKVWMTNLKLSRHWKISRRATPKAKLRKLRCASLTSNVEIWVAVTAKWTR